MFTDVESSTVYWEQHPLQMSEALAIHDELLRRLIATSRGYEVKTEGDAFMVAFADPVDAIRWCLDVQRELDDVQWPEPLGELRIRAGGHVAEPERRLNPTTRRIDYFGPPVNRAARVSSVAHGGQVLVSGELWVDTEGRRGELGAFTSTDLGDFSLKGLTGPTRLVQLLPEALASRRFGPPRIEAGQKTAARLARLWTAERRDQTRDALRRAGCSDTAAARVVDALDAYQSACSSELDRIDAYTATSRNADERHVRLAWLGECIAELQTLLELLSRADDEIARHAIDACYGLPSPDTSDLEALRNRRPSPREQPV